jgi:predicted nucleic acid-binding protein
MRRRKWTFDTVVLSNFLLSDSLFLIEKRYNGKGFITSEVYGELSAGFTSYPQLQHVDKFLDSGAFELTSLSRKELKIYKQLIGHLGRGEASCIAIADNRNTIMVLDDRAARSQCIQMNIPVTGTIGILKTSVIGGLLTTAKADKILPKMVEKGFYSPVRSMADIT